MTRPVRVYLVRHAKTAEPWRTALDAPLSDDGHRQAEKAARALAPLGPLSLWTSPLQRARQTAAPLAKLWRTEAHVEPRITEIPAPSTDAKARGDWLMRMLTAKWASLDEAIENWRNNVLSALDAVREDTVMFTHYVVINAAVGAATGDERVICCNPDNTDTTIIEKIGDRLSVVGYSLDEIADKVLAGGSVS